MRIHSSSLFIALTLGAMLAPGITGHDRSMGQAQEAPVAGKARSELPTRRLDLACGLIFFDEQPAIIRSEADAIRSSFEPACRAAMRDIDFRDLTVIGVRVISGWCGVPRGLRYRTIRDDAARRYVLEVRFAEPGEPCRAMSTYNLWVAVPALPDDYDVDFDIAADAEASTTN